MATVPILPLLYIDVEFSYYNELMWDIRANFNSLFNWTQYGINPIVNDNSAAIDGIFDYLFEQIFPDINWLKPRLSTAISDINRIDNYVYGGLQNILRELDEDLGHVEYILNDRITTVNEAIWRAIGNNLNTLNARITTVNDAIWTAIGNNLNTLNDRITAVNEAIWTAIGNNLNTLNARITAVYDALLLDIMNNFNTLNNKITAGNTAIWDTIWDNLNTVNARITVIDDQHIANYTTLLDTINTKLFPDLGNISKDLNVLKGYVEANISGLRIELDNRINFVFDNLTDRITVVNNAIWTAIGNNLNNLNTRITTVNDDIRETIGDNYNILDTRITEEIERVDKQISFVFNNLDNRISVVNEAIWKAIGNNLNNLNDRISSVADILIDEIVRLEVLISESVEGLVTDEYYPLVMLHGILTDQNGVYTNYKDEWQKFATIILG